MNEEMKKAYRDTFSEIHAPEALAGKVRNMSNMKKDNKGVIFMRKWVAVAALALVLLVGGNGVVYAATGNTLLQAVVIRFNGTSVEAEMAGDVEGDVSYTVSATVEEGSGAVDITERTEIEILPYSVTPVTPEVVEENGIILLKDGDVEIDITKDLQDGTATGSYEKDGLETYYEVTGKDSDWEVTISNGSYEAPQSGGATEYILQEDTETTVEETQPAKTDMK